MEIRGLRTLVVEIFKTINEINPPYMKKIFIPKENTKVKQNDIIVKRINTSRFGTQSLRSLGPKIWNNLPSNIKYLTYVTASHFVVLIHFAHLLQMYRLVFVYGHVVCHILHGPTSQRWGQLFGSVLLC